MKLVKLSSNFITSYNQKASEVLGKDHWVIMHEVEVSLTLDNNKVMLITIPEGYLTDGATVPKVLQNLYPSWDITCNAAIIHDYLCDYGYVIYADNPNVIEFLSRGEVDDIFKQLLKYYKVPSVQANLMSTAVKAYGVVMRASCGGISPLKKQIEKLLKEDINSGILK